MKENKMVKDVRQLDEQKERIETGVVRFGDDWCGLFLRGDDCLRYAISLDIVLDDYKRNPKYYSAVDVICVENLIKLLSSTRQF